MLNNLEKFKKFKKLKKITKPILNIYKKVDDWQTDGQTYMTYVYVTSRRIKNTNSNLVLKKRGGGSHLPHPPVATSLTTILLGQVCCTGTVSPNILQTHRCVWHGSLKAIRNWKFWGWVVGGLNKEIDNQISYLTVTSG